MNKLFNYASLVFALLCAVVGSAQDFSNKGKDFWIGYGNHVRMFNGGAAEQMQLYITSDVSTTGNVTISSIGFNQNFTVTANQITTINIPRTAALMDHGLYSHGIHVTAAKPVVVYSFIYVNAISGATVCLPTNTLGREYYSVNYTQLSNETNSHSYFFVVAADTGTTTVEITPAAITKAGQAANVPFTVTLTQGQIYQVLGQVTGSSGVDMTGSKIRSINTGAGCKKIGVYCGSGKISIGCTSPSTGSSDNLYQQMYPTQAWGKTYITVPTTNNNSNFQTNIYRIIRPDATSVVKLNGVVVPSASFTNGFYYQFNSNGTNVIESDKPILVAQYFSTSANSPAGLNCGNSGIGDPEMIYLNPLEQTINNVTINSMQPSSGTAITTHFINIVLPNNSQSINSFKIDGNTYIGSFSPVVQDPRYAYARIQVGSQGHTVVCDSGFNLIAYGFGSAESYGYSGGTNLRDLYQFVSIQNNFATVNYPATCKDAPFLFSMTFPYEPLQVTWKFNGLFNDTTIVNPVYDSTWVVSGRTLYRYQLPRSYVVSNTGLYPIKILVKNPTPDGCTGEQEIDYEIEVFNRPVADFNVVNNGCLTDSVRFTDITANSGRPTIKWHWNFDDATTSALKNPVKLFNTPKTYNVKFSVITDIGCISDTVTKAVILFDPPVSKFLIKSTLCIGKTVTFSDSSYAPAAATLSKWIWNFGDGSPTRTVNSNMDQTHVYANTGSYDVTLIVETTTGCRSLVYKETITINSNPKADFSLPNVCLPAGTAQFNNQSTISSGTLSYAWDFGNATTAGNVLNPVANYSAVGPYNVKLTATSDKGCTHDSTKVLSTIYAQPQANFSAPAEVCLGNAANFADLSAAPSSSVTQWQWDFGDASTSTIKNPSRTYATAGSYTVTLNVNSAIGCPSTTATKNVIVNPLPTVDFTTSSPLCEKGSITFTSTSVANAGVFTQYEWKVNGIVVGGNSSTMNFTPPVAGNYSVQLTVLTDKGCSLVGVKNIVVNVKPFVDFSLPNVCLPAGSAQFNNLSSISSGTLSYAWDFGNATTAGNVLNPIATYSAVGPYNVKLTATSDKGCTHDTTKVLSTIYAQPQANFSAPAEVCLGDVASFTDLSTATSSTVTQWLWNFGDASTSNLKNPSRTYATAGSYSITLNVNSAIGCPSSTATKTVIVNPLPTVDFSSSSPLCEKGTITFTSTSVANAGTFTQYDWYINAVKVGGNTPTMNFTPASAGTYKISLTVITDKGCTSFISKDIIVNSRPFVDFSLPNVCLPSGSAQFNNLSTISSGTLSYAWDFGNATTAGNVMNPIATYSAVGPYNVKLTATSDKGCTHDTTQVLNTIYVQPQANFSAPVEVCLGDAANFTDLSSAASSTVTEWLWNFGDATSSTQQTPGPKTYTTAQSYNVTLTVKSAIGCPSTIATKSVVVNPLPVANFNTSLPSCETKDITFSDASAANAGSLVNWSWDFGDGNTKIATTNSPFTHSYSTAGSYPVSLFVETNKGCKSTLVLKSVAVNPQPVPGFIKPDVCLSDPFAQFTDTSKIADGTEGSFTYLWNFGDPNSLPINNTSALKDPRHSYSATGIYNVSLTVTSNNGCITTITEPFTVNGSIPQAVFTVQDPTALCSNKDVVISDNSTVDFGSIVKVEIFWDFLNDPTNKTVDNNPARGKQYNKLYPDFGTPATKTYTIRMVSYSGINCVNSTSQTITLKASPKVVFNNMAATCEENQQFQITQAREIYGISGSGIYSGTGISSSGIFNPKTAGPGLHTIRYTFNANNGCSTFEENSIIVNQSPVANAGPDKTVLEGGFNTLSGSASGNGISFIWSPPTAMDDVSKLDPIVTPTDDITYRLSVTSSDGCVSFDDVFVKVLKAPTIPNAFSPNGDGINDKWEILYLETYPGAVIEIYNRYGQLIFRSTGYATPWDGTFNGKPVPSGTYYYIVNPKNGRKQITGFVDVLR